MALDQGLLTPLETTLRQLSAGVPSLDCVHPRRNPSMCPNTQIEEPGSYANESTGRINDARVDDFKKIRSRHVNDCSETEFPVPIQHKSGPEIGCRGS
jgi:hypothetical protein